MLLLKTLSTCHSHLGTEVILKLRLSSTCTDVKLPVYSKDTIGQCKKKLQVSDNVVPSHHNHAQSLPQLLPTILLHLIFPHAFAVA